MTIILTEEELQAIVKIHYAASGYIVTDGAFTGTDYLISLTDTELK